MNKNFYVCPVCKQLHYLADGTTVDFSYHTNAANFNTLNVNLSEGVNAGMMMGGANNKQYTLQICKECCALPVSNTNGTVADILAKCETLKVADDTLKSTY